MLQKDGLETHCVDTGELPVALDWAIVNELSLIVQSQTVQVHDD
jgi:hypothetical protein